MKIGREFYLHDDVVKVTRSLLGKFLCTRIDGIFTSGMITEAEAYNGRTDRACHAHNQRFTHRTRVMYGMGGYAYVYLCYGIHNLFNIVTNTDGLADAILVRAVQPIDGVDEMLNRRSLAKSSSRISAGPGLVTQALGITREHYGEDLTGNTIWLEDRGIKFTNQEISTGPRIGVDYAGEDAFLPWRFWIKDSIWVSKRKG